MLNLLIEDNKGVENIVTTVIDLNYTRIVQYSNTWDNCTSVVLNNGTFFKVALSFIEFHEIMKEQGALLFDERYKEQIMSMYKDNYKNVRKDGDGKESQN